MELLGYAAMIGIGVVLGSVGAGGSMLAIPVLVYLFSLDMETASAYSLFLVGATSLAGAAIKRSELLITARAALMFGIPSVTATFVARKWVIAGIPECLVEWRQFHLTKEALLLSLFALLLISSSVLLLVRENPEGRTPSSANALYLVLAGLIIGMLAGLIGAGGGFLILPALIFFAGLHFSAAVGTTLVIIASNSLIGFFGDVLTREINWYFLSLVTALSISGLLIGYWSKRRMGPVTKYHRILPWSMIATGVFVLTRVLTG